MGLVVFHNCRIHILFKYSSNACSGNTRESQLNFISSAIQTNEVDWGTLIFISLEMWLRGR